EVQRLRANIVPMRLQCEEQQAIRDKERSCDETQMHGRLRPCGTRMVEQPLDTLQGLPPTGAANRCGGFNPDAHLERSMTVVRGSLPTKPACPDQPFVCSR